MNVLAHPDPHVLERELLDRVAAARAEDRLSPVLVLVPTTILARHVQRRLGQRLGAVLGVEVLHHRAFALRVMDAVGVRPTPPASERILARLLSRTLEELPENPWARFVARRPGALTGLLGALRDLREAGVEAREARALLKRGRDAALAEIYGRWVESLEAGAARGLGDETGLVRAALPHVTAFAGRYGLALHHGAYELIGIHLDLVRAVDAGSPVTFLLPGAPGAPAFRHAVEFARRHLLDRTGVPGWLDPGGGGLIGERLSALYREEARPEPPRSSITFRDVQGGGAEVRAAVRSAMAAVAGGTPPQETVVAARSLEPFAPHIEAELADAGLPVTSSLVAPLARDPAVRDFVVLLRAAAEGFPRAAAAEVLRSPRIRWDAVLPGEPPPAGDLADAWSRAAGIIGGVEEWRARLPRWAAAPEDAEDDGGPWRRAEAERIVRALEALARRLRPERSRTWSRHARELRDAARLLFEGMAAAAEGGPLAAILEDMERLETLLGESDPVPCTVATEWLRTAVEQATLRPLAEDHGGVRVLDAMQARGLTFRRVEIIGMQAGLLPRPPREDPFLPDAARRALAERTGRPLPAKGEGDGEERLLLALLLGSAGEGLALSWQRADEAGRPRSPSLVLREVARLGLGRPDMEAVLEAAARNRLPAHPEAALRRLAAAPGLLSPSEATLLQALAAGLAEDRLPAGSAGDLASGIAMLRATEAWIPGGGAYDGRVGGALPIPEAMSVSAAESLGRCPLQYFFRHGLRVIPLEPAADPFEAEAREMGLVVHQVLEALYRRLRDEGALAAGGDLLLRRAREILPEAWGVATDATTEGRRPRAPLLWEAVEARWLEAIRWFVEDDLAALAAGGMRLVDVERGAEADLDLGAGTVQRFRGRFDRVLEDARGAVVVGDYKTGGGLREKVKPAAMLRGAALQVPLYAMLAGADARVELLGVGPDYAPGGCRDEGSRERFEGFPSPEMAAGFRETLRILVESARRGSFPLRSGDHCGWCDFAAACRRNHPPTAHRENHDPDVADLRDLARKSTRNVALAAVRGGAGSRGREEG